MTLLRAGVIGLLLLSGCGRALTPNERAFLSTLTGPSLDMDRARLAQDLAPPTIRRLPAPPRLTCQSRLYPPPAEPTVRSATGAMTIFERVSVRRDLWREDMAEGYPDILPLADAMLLAHEMVHVWQWQNRTITGYHPLRAAFEHARHPDPYLFELESADFLDYGYEQQGAIMEEYVCCRTLAPEAPRTARLHAMLSEYFPLRPLDDGPLTEWVTLPWDGVQIEGICDGPLEDRRD